MAKKLSKEQWEQRIRDTGAGRYELVRWEVDGEFGAKKYCIVRCLSDGFEWRVAPHNFINNGSGCPQCAGQRKWTGEERIEQINRIDSIEFVCWVDSYKNSNSKANVKCKVDGFEWSSEVGSLVHGGHGCPKCANVRRWTADERIEQINEIKNIEFISWVGVYKNHSSKANVRCTIDNFEWSPRVNDLVNQGSGCPRCAKYCYDKSKTGYLYALRSECGIYVKVGISNKPKTRILHLEKRTPFNFSHIEQVSGGGAEISELEKHFHSKYERAGFTGFSGATEWLVCKPELLEELRDLGDK